MWYQLQVLEKGAMFGHKHNTQHTERDCIEYRCLLKLQGSTLFGCQASQVHDLKTTTKFMAVPFDLTSISTNGHKRRQRQSGNGLHTLHRAPSMNAKGARGACTAALRSNARSRCPVSPTSWVYPEPHCSHMLRALINCLKTTTTNMH